MKKFEMSEKYRKYFIEIKLTKNNSFYSVWGTDLGDEENDKLLVKDGKLLLFRDVNEFITQINNYKDSFFDSENFENWTIKESFQEAESIIDLNSLGRFSMETLTNKDLAFDLIDSLNLIHDFYIQIGKKERLLASKLILNLRDNLYNNHFWKNDGFELPGVTEGDLEKT